MCFFLDCCMSDLILSEDKKKNDDYDEINAQFELIRRNTIAREKRVLRGSKSVSTDLGTKSQNYNCATYTRR